MLLRSVCFFSLYCLASLSAIADPSGRVAQLSSLQGAVTLIHPSSGEAQLASLNWPITGDDELVTDNFSRAEIRLGATAIRLGSNSDLTIMQLDDDQLRLRLNRGTLELHVRNTNKASDLTLDIAQGRIAFLEPTDLRVDSRADNDVSAINVLSGASYFDDGISRFVIAAGRRAEIDRGGLRVMDSRNNFRDDGFDTWFAERDRQDQVSGTPRYVSSDITGYQVLNSYGTWRSTTTYGPIWSPTIIPTGWAPYRDGRWTWIAPWGWTWVDNAPWGYAPSHYGRWVFYEQRWCWTPGAISARPVWAPALVGWVGGDGGSYGGNYGNTGGGPAIGWFPLAPREVYVPAYQATPRYFQQVNNGYPIDRNTSYRAGGVADPRTSIYQNQLVRNATTVLPSYQFSSGKTVVVTPSPQRNDQVLQARTLAAPASAPTLVIPPAGRLSAVSPMPAAPTAAPSLQVQTSTEPVLRSDRRSNSIGAYAGASVGASVGASAANRAAPINLMTNPHQPSSPTGSTIIVRPVQPVPLRQMPAAQLAAPAQGAPLREQGGTPPTSQKKEDANKIAPELQPRVRPGSTGSPDNAVLRDAFGRGALQR